MTLLSSPPSLESKVCSLHSRAIRYGLVSEQFLFCVRDIEVSLLILTNLNQIHMTPMYISDIIQSICSDDKPLGSDLQETSGPVKLLRVG